jgi:23S rRNA pseudouridine955/2504/2580 synthase
MQFLIYKLSVPEAIMKKVIIGDNDFNQRLDRFIQKMIPAMPASLLQKYIRTKRIKVNGKRAKNSQILSNGDCIELFIRDEFVLPFENPALTFMASKNNLDVLYEDKHLLLVNKAPGLVVHEDQDKSPDTLIARIQRYLFEKGEYSPENEQSFSPALCNRIDRNTGGIVIAAKDAPTLRVVNELIRNHLIKKKYLCLVHGIPSPLAGTLKNYLLKDSERNRVAVYNTPVKGAKMSETFYKTLSSKGNYSLVEVELITGRTHQIRAQFAQFGYPLVEADIVIRLCTPINYRYRHQKKLNIFPI